LNITISYWACFARNESYLTRDALPGFAVSDPGINEALTLGDAFSFLGFSDAKDATVTAASP
jgi:hypothetical protein